MSLLSRFVYEPFSLVCRTEENVNCRSALFGGASALAALYSCHHFIKYSAPKSLVASSIVLGTAGIGIFLLATLKVNHLPEKQNQDASSGEQREEISTQTEEGIDERNWFSGVPDSKDNLSADNVCETFTPFLLCIWRAMLHRGIRYKINVAALSKFKGYDYSDGDEYDFRSAIDRRALKNDAFSEVGLKYIELFYRIQNEIEHHVKETKISVYSKCVLRSKCIMFSRVQDLICTYMHMVDKAHNLDRDVEIRNSTVYPIEIISYERVVNAYNLLMSYDTALKSPNELYVFAAYWEMLNHLQETANWNFVLQ